MFPAESGAIPRWQPLFAGPVGPRGRCSGRLVRHPQADLQIRLQTGRPRRIPNLVRRCSWKHVGVGFAGTSGLWKRPLVADSAGWSRLERVASVQQIRSRKHKHGHFV